MPSFHPIYWQMIVKIFVWWIHIFWIVNVLEVWCTTWLLSIHILWYLNLMYCLISGGEVGILGTIPPLTRCVEKRNNTQKKKRTLLWHRFPNQARIQFVHKEAESQQQTLYEHIRILLKPVNLVIVNACKNDLKKNKHNLHLLVW